MYGEPGYEPTYCNQLRDPKLPSSIGNYRWRPADLDMALAPVRP
jgi:hypothetical protein